MAYFLPTVGRTMCMGETSMVRTSNPLTRYRSANFSRCCFLALSQPTSTTTGRGWGLHDLPVGSGEQNSKEPILNLTRWDESDKHRVNSAGLMWAGFFKEKDKQKNDPSNLANTKYCEICTSFSQICKDKVVVTKIVKIVDCGFIFWTHVLSCDQCDLYLSL